jgi:hypothetical protein
MEALGKAYAVSTEGVMFSGRLFDAVLGACQSWVWIGKAGAVHTPMGLAAVRITREASLKVNDIEWQQTSELEKSKSRTSQQQLST